MKVLPKTYLREPLDVLIIGAGWSALAAARHLQKHNIHDFWIVEGRDYVGGRSQTVTLNDGSSRAELGSQWIQGANPSNPVYQALLDTGMDYSKSNDDSSSAVYSTCIGDEGLRRVPDSEVRRLVEHLFEGPTGFFEYQARFQDKGEVDRSLRSIADQYIEEKGLSNWEVHALEWMLDSFIAAEYAASLEDLSHWWWDDDNDLFGEDLYLAHSTNSGFTNVVENYCTAFLDKVYLQRRVSSIDWGKPTVAVRVEKTDSLRTESAEIFAKRVILTVPLGVLKEGTINFVPKLPSEKVRAIENLGMGLTNKVILLWNKTDILPWPHDKEWIERIDLDGKQGRWTEFFSPASLNGQPVLYAYISGGFAHKMEEENYSDKQIEQEVLASLTTIFGNIPKPRQTLIQRWGEDEFSMGSYSYNKVGSTPRDRKALARPLKNRLYFAGEATHKQHFATVQGALLSGIAAAKQIASSIEHDSTSRHKPGANQIRKRGANSRKTRKKR